MHQPSQCEDDRGTKATPLHLDARSRALIESTNSEVNRSTRWVEDSYTNSQQEHFDLVRNGKGDCEDIALTKRLKLHQAGIPFHDLRLAVGKNPRGELHAVLVVITDAGDLVLNSPDTTIHNWRDMQFTWLKRQDGSAVGWETIPHNA